MGLELNKKELDKHKRDWLLVLAYIGAQRTQTATFRKLFEKVLKDDKHPYHRQATTLSKMYDFTPLRRSDVDETPFQ